MKITELALRPPVVVACDATIADAAALMADAGVGALIVVDGDRPVGIVTDRDIVTRGVAQGRSPDGRIDGLMSMGLIALDHDAEMEDLVHVFDHHAVRRVPVVDHDRVVGVIALDDLLVALSKDLGDITKVLAAQIMFPHAADEPPAPARR